VNDAAADAPLGSRPTGDLSTPLPVSPDTGQAVIPISHFVMQKGTAMKCLLPAAVALIAAAHPRAQAAIDLNAAADVAKLAAAGAAHGGPTHDFLLWQDITLNGRDSVPPDTTICETSYLNTNGKTQAAVAAPQMVISLFGLLGHDPLETTTPRTSVLSVTGDLLRRVRRAVAEASPFQDTMLSGGCDLATHTRLALYVVSDPKKPSVLIGFECEAPGAAPTGATTKSGTWLWRMLKTLPSACSGIPFGDFEDLPRVGQP
jgi:hypothetical protein